MYRFTIAALVLGAVIVLVFWGDSYSKRREFLTYAHEHGKGEVVLAGSVVNFEPVSGNQVSVVQTNPELSCQIELWDLSPSGHIVNHWIRKAKISDDPTPQYMRDGDCDRLQAILSPVKEERLQMLLDRIDERVHFRWYHMK
jgi:hypothetical protein